MPFMASMAWDMTGTAAAAAEGPQAQLEDSGARFFFSRGMLAKPTGEKSRAQPLRPRAAEAQPVSVIKPFEEAVKGMVSRGAKETGWRVRL
jgi:hypothetical protein